MLHISYQQNAKRQDLHTLAAALLEHETLTLDDIKTVLQGVYGLCMMCGWFVYVCAYTHTQLMQTFHVHTLNTHTPHTHSTHAPHTHTLHKHISFTLNTHVPSQHTGKPLRPSTPDSPSGSTPLHHTSTPTTTSTKSTAGAQAGAEAGAEEDAVAAGLDVTAAVSAAESGNAS